MKGLTKRQSEIVDFIEEFIVNRGYSPSYQEIMTRFKFSSLGSVFKHLQTLKRKGLITSEARCGRSIALTNPPQREDIQGGIEVAVIGYVAANCPIEMFPQLQSIRLPPLMVPNPEASYILRARGDSLVDEHILDGDLIIVETMTEAEPGRLVVALNESRNAVVGRYFPAGQHIRLESATAGKRPLLLQPDKITIYGVVSSILRMC